MAQAAHDGSTGFLARNPETSIFKLDRRDVAIGQWQKADCRRV
jgi:hypothetical protein